MKKILIGCLGAMLMWSVCLAADKKELKTEAERINYSIGYQIGGDFQRQGWQLHPEILTQGIRDAINRADPLMTPEQINSTLVNLKKKLVADERNAARQADEAFLAENAKREGVVTLPSGLQYKVIQSGGGKQPAAKDSVTIQYRVGRVDGGRIAMDPSKTQPKSYAMKSVLPGLREVLQFHQQILPPPLR